jgi:excisionase family DNA binding protein
LEGELPIQIDIMAMAAIDLGGEKFGRWTVLERAGSDKHGATWVCVCQCGELRIVMAKSLRNGDSQSCSCLRRERATVAEITGQHFGRLTVIERAGSGKHKYALWRCVCDCGTVKIVNGNSLRRGRTQSCGCLRKLAAHRGHGHTRHGRITPEYSSYKASKQRCENPRTPRYSDYGGRSIRFLFTSFEQFYAELGPRPEPKRLYSVDRIDNDGNYEPGNVKWSTRSEQQRNKRPRKPRSAVVDCIMAMAEEWMTANEAAEYLKVKPRSLLLWVRAGKLPAYSLSGMKRRVWRFRREDLDSAILSRPVLHSPEGENHLGRII